MTPIERSVVLACDPERAFRLFTERMSDWWPADRRHTNDPHSRLTVSPEGAFVEVSGDREVVLGRVLAWQAPDRLLLAWFPGTDAEHPTEVEITFVAESGGTRVAVRHGPTASSRDLWQARAPRYLASWDRVLAALAVAKW